MASDPLPFAIEIIKPDPSSSKQRLRRAGLVLATFEGQEVGHLIYGVGPGDGVLLITDTKVHDDFLRRGCLTQMSEHLLAAFPGFVLKDGGNTNTVVGDCALEGLRRKGLVV